MKRREKLTLSKERKEQVVSTIKNYYLKERDEEIGDLAAGLMLDLIIDEIAPEFYNQGVYDSYAFMGERVEELLEIRK
ncbi:MAG: DUF2164 domain-containing protein [Methanomassiliicoccus sp.]|nr:DUF2164 domain-containing protein [Methanomassiliicoccus sp.]